VFGQPDTGQAQQAQRFPNHGGGTSAGISRGTSVEDQASPKATRRSTRAPLRHLLTSSGAVLAVNPLPAAAPPGRMGPGKPLQKNSVAAKFFYAALITIILVLVTAYILREPKKEGEGE